MYYFCQFKGDGELILSMTVLIATIKNYRDLLKKRLETATSPCAIPSTSGLQQQEPGMNYCTKFGIEMQIVHNAN